MYLLKYRDIFNREPIKAPGFGYKNEVRAVISNPDGSIDQDTGWVPNMIVTQGIDRIGTHSWTYSICIGSGNTPTVLGDVQLEAVTAYATQCSVEAYQNFGTPTYVWETVCTERFNAGIATGTIEEIAFYSSGTINNMTCRVVIPQITKSAIQILDIYYKIIVTPDLTDTTGNVAINGINYDYTCRLYDVGDMLNSRNLFGPRVGTGTTNSANAGAQNVNPWDPKNLTGGNDTMYTSNIDRTTPRVVTWTTIAYIGDGNFTIPGGIVAAYSRMNFGISAGQEGGVSVGFAATSGPDIGLGIPKVLTQQVNLDWTSSWTVP